MHMPVDPRLGRRRRVGPHIAGVAVRQIEDEEVCLARHTPDHRTRLAEVRLPMAGWMDQRHEHLPPPAVMFARIVLHDRVAAAEPVLGAKPVEDTLGRVALLAQLLQILLQPLIDDLAEPVQLRAPNRCRPPIARRYRKAQHLLHALARNPEMTRRRTLAHPVPAGETDLPIQFHGMHAPALPPSPGRAQVAEFRSARSETIPPLPWTNFSPPFPHVRQRRWVGIS